MKVIEINVPVVEGRERRPSVVFLGNEVMVIHYLVLEPGEEIDDSPPQESMTLAEWKQRHADFGLTIDGKPVAGASP